jgi:hypothetical protein
MLIHGASRAHLFFGQANHCLCVLGTDASEKSTSRTRAALRPSPSSCSMITETQRTPSEPVTDTCLTVHAFEFEMSRGGRDRDRVRDSGRDGGRDGGRERDRDRGKTGGKRTDFGVVVSGLPRSCSWQDLKDFMRKAGDVAFADVDRRGEGFVDYFSAADLDRAIETLDNTEFKNPFDTCTIRVKASNSSSSAGASSSKREGSAERGRDSRRRSHSRSRSPASDRSRSRDRNGKNSSRSPSPRRSSSRERRSASPAREGKDC